MPAKKGRKTEKTKSHREIKEKSVINESLVSQSLKDKTAETAETYKETGNIKETDKADTDVISMPTVTQETQLLQVEEEQCTQLPQIQSDDHESPLPSRSSTPSSLLTHSPTQPQKTVTDLTDEQEQDMVSWLEENELIYNKKLNAYKDYRKKDALWESKAATLCKTVEMLKTWYRSIRTRYTRLTHRKSGDGAAELTERDIWILRNFAWLKVHITEVKKKTTVSLKEKISSAASVEEGNDDQSDDPTDSESVQITTRQRLDTLPKRSTSCKKKIIQQEEQFLSNMAAREEHSLAFQTKVLEMLTPSMATERTRYADWTKEVMLSLHPSLWFKFQRKCTNLLYTYREKSEDINLSTQQHHQPSQLSQFSSQPLYATQQQPQLPFYTKTSGSSGALLQAPPHQWNSNVQQNIPLWQGPYNTAWEPAQMSEEQQVPPVVSVVRGPSPVNAPIRNVTSTVTQSAKPAFSLSKVVSDTIEMTDTPLDKSVANIDASV